MVPKTEGTKTILLPEFEPRPVLCDNNVSALPIEYKNSLLRNTKSWSANCDINSGFEPHSFNDEIYDLWKGFYRGAWRFGFDTIGEEKPCQKAARVLINEPGPKKRVYVLIGNEPFDQCEYRVKRVIEWGCEPARATFYCDKSIEKKP